MRRRQIVEREQRPAIFRQALRRIVAYGIRHRTMQWRFQYLQTEARERLIQVSRESGDQHSELAVPVDARRRHQGGEAIDQLPVC